MTKDELYFVIDDVLHERYQPYTNPGSFWIEQSDGDVQLRIHELTEELCDAVYRAIEDLTADPTIYKHQCGHCSRLSPLPFLIPGYLLDGAS